MGVGGPNRRTDFHLEAGAEFFWQQRGGMELPIVQQGRRRLVRIQEGDVFLLPPRMPHSPQRDADSFGIVVERERALRELDTLRWYTDFDTCQTVLWEQSFHCADLGRDLVPVVEAFKSSDEFKSGLPSGAPRAPPPTGAVIQDEDSEAPVPFSLLGKPRTRIFFDTSGTHHFFGRHAIFGDTPFGPCATLPVLTKTPRPIVLHLSLAATTPPSVVQCAHRLFLTFSPHLCVTKLVGKMPKFSLYACLGWPLAGPWWPQWGVQKMHIDCFWHFCHLIL